MIYIYIKYMSAIDTFIEANSSKIVFLVLMYVIISSGYITQFFPCQTQELFMNNYWIIIEATKKNNRNATKNNEKKTLNKTKQRLLTNATRNTSRPPFGID